MLTTKEIRRLNNMNPPGSAMQLGDRMKYSTLSGFNLGEVTLKGDVWFCDATNGHDDRDGKSWAKAFATIGAANTAATAGDTILLVGTFTEAVAVAKAGLTFIGAGPTVESNIWMESAADDDLVTLTAGKCRFVNIRFRIPTTGGQGIVMSGADYAQIIGCKFQGRGGSTSAIYTDGSSDNVKILGCEFMYNNTASTGFAIQGHTYTADVIHSSWEIAGCLFHSNTNHIVCRMRQSFIHDNQIVAVGLDNDNGELTATKNLDLSGGSNAKWNVVTKNILSGDYSNTGGYTAGTNDMWTGNIADDVAEAEVDAGGVTITVPAA